MQERKPWKGTFALWTGGGGYVGSTSDTKVHAHHALQLCFALEAPFRLRSGPSRNWEEFSAALIGSDAPHQLDGGGQRMVLVYLEPESEAARRIQSQFPAAAIQSILSGNLFPLLEQLASAGPPPTDSLTLFNQVVTALGGSVSLPVTMDERIVQATRLLHESGEELPTLRELAEKIQLSPSRLGHLFREQTGLPLRCYRLWLRLRRALEALDQSGSLTTAAHAAAFADSAHFSRTFRRMFGIAPSELVVERNPHHSGMPPPSDLA